MNKEEILNEIEKTKEHLANMEKMLEECECARWTPIDSEMYFFVDSYGKIVADMFCSADSIDSQRYKNYNCFQTREQAETEAEKILVRRMLEDIARRLNKGKKIDWDNHKPYKYSICFNSDKNEIDYLYCSSQKEQGVVYCLSNEFYKVAIQEVGEERLKKYLRGE